jgi:hypothetical protein
MRSMGVHKNHTFELWAIWWSVFDVKIQVQYFYTRSHTFQLVEINIYSFFLIVVL